MPKKFDKFNRPAEPPNGRISERDLDIVEAVLRYRFSPASELLRLCGGNHTTTKKRLTWLWRKGLINRFAFADPRRASHSEFSYYLDRKESLDLLFEYGRLADIHPQMESELRQNREAKYGAAWLDASSGKSLFLRHQLMISRMRFMLEMACFGSAGQVDLSMFRPDLTAYRVTAPAIAAKRQEDGRYEWAETDKEEKLPIKPDAIFSITRHSPPGADGGGTSPPRQIHFAYEADRGTMPIGDMLKKLRAYHFLIKRYKKQQEAFGFHPVRAVLIEAPTEVRCLKLMELACHPLVAGPSRRSGLFWFVPSFVFTDGEGTTSPPYLDNPAAIFQPLWALPQTMDTDGSIASVTKHSLLDEENSGR